MSWGSEGMWWLSVLPLPCSLLLSCLGLSLPGATKPDMAGRRLSPAPVPVTSVSKRGDCSVSLQTKTLWNSLFSLSLELSVPRSVHTQQHREGQLLQGLAGSEVKLYLVSSYY